MNQKLISFLSTASLYFMCMLMGCMETQAANLKREIRVMSFNIRNGTANDKSNHWNLRKEFVYQVIGDYSPDILGLQEATDFQLKELSKKFPEYEKVGLGSMGGSKGQHSSIHYLKQKFKLMESGNFWLSETPTKLSKHWGSAHHRICTWVKLFDKDTQKPIYIYNTHMDDGSRKAREKGIQLIMNHLNQRVKSNPFILMGDFNASEDSEVIAYLKGTSKLTPKFPIKAVDSFRVLHPERKDVGTYNGFTGQSEGPKIDYIMVSPVMKIIEASILKSNWDGRYPSDHFPVTARLLIE